MKRGIPVISYSIHNHYYPEEAVMKTFFSLAVLFLISGCSSQPLATSSVILPSQTTQPSPSSATLPSPSSTLQPMQTSGATETCVPTATLDRLSTLIAISPSIEVTFTEKGCSVNVLKELSKGKHVIVLINQSGEAGYIFIARNYPGWTWEDVLKDIGTPGSQSAKARNMVLLQSDDFKVADEKVSYRLFTLNIPAEYNIVFEGSGKYNGIYPCGPFVIKE